MLSKIENVNGNYSDNTLTPPIDSSLRQGDTTRRLMLHGGNNGDGIDGEFSVIRMNKRSEELTPSMILDFDEKNQLQTQNSNNNNNADTNNNNRYYNPQVIELTTSSNLLTIQKQQQQLQLHEQTSLSATHNPSVFQISQKQKQHHGNLQHQTSILLSPKSRNNMTHKSNLSAHPRHNYKSLSNVVHVTNDRSLNRKGFSGRKSKTLQDLKGKHQQFDVSPLKKRLHTHSHNRISSDKGDLLMDATRVNSIASSSPTIHKNHKQPQQYPKYEFSMARSHYHNNPNQIVTPTQELDSLSDKNGKTMKLKRIWKQQGLMIVTLVKKFVQKMQNLSYIRRFNKQTNHQFTVINDKAGFYDPLRGNYLLDDSIFRHRLILAKLKIFNNILLKKIVQMVQHKIPLIEPDSYVFVGATIVMLTILLLLLFFNPIFMAFQTEMTQSGLLSSNLSQFCFGKLPMILFLANGILHINTAYYQRGLIITDRWKILVHYLKGRMLVDIALVILFLFIDFQDIRILFVISALIIKKIQYLRRDLEDAITLQKKWSSIYELAKLALFVLIVAHFCGCLFWSVGIRTMYFKDQSWIINEGLVNSSFYEKYISSLYYAIVTMLTVGYGDIHPYNFIEKEIVILIMIISCGVYAYSLNKIGVLIQEIPSEDNEFKQNFSSISLYMKKRNLEVKIQNEVKRYYQYLNWEKHNYSQNRDIMLNPLNQSLKRKVLMSINLQFLLQYKMFSLHFSLPFLQKLALVMKEQEFMPDDKVWESSDIEFQNRIFFIVRGQVRQLVNSQFVVKIIDEGGYFNEKSFVVDEISHVSFISTCVSTLVILEKKDFTEIIRQFPQDYEIYCKLRDQAKNLAFLSILDSKCETCELFTHNFNSCPQVNLKISKEKLIYQNNLNIPAERKPFLRQPLNPQKLFQSSSNTVSVPALIENSRHLNAITFRRYLVESIIDYIIDYNPLDLDEDSLIEYMKEVVDYNENYGEELQLQTSPTQTAFLPPPLIPYPSPSLFNNNGNSNDKTNHKNLQQQQSQEELHQSGRIQQQPLNTQDSKLFFNQDSKLQANLETTDDNYLKDLTTSNENISSLQPNQTRPKRSSISHRSMLLLNTNTTTSNLNSREQLQLLRSFPGQKTNEIINNNNNNESNNNYKTNPSDIGYFQKGSNSKTINTINEEGHIELPIFKNKNKDTKLQQLQTLASLGKNINNSSNLDIPSGLDKPERIIQQQAINNSDILVDENVNDLSEQNNSHVLVPDSNNTNVTTTHNNIHTHNVINGYSQPFNFNHLAYLHQATSSASNINNNLPSPSYNYNNNSIDQSVLSIAAIQSGIIQSNLTNNNLNQMNGNRPNTPAKYFNNQQNNSNVNIPLSSGSNSNSPSNYFNFPRDNYNQFSTPKNNNNNNTINNNGMNSNPGGNISTTMRAQRSLKKIKSSMIPQSPRDDKIKQPSFGGHSQSQDSATEKQLLQNNNNFNIPPNYSSQTSNLLNNVFNAYSNNNNNLNTRPSRQIFDSKVRFTQEIKDTSSQSHYNNNNNNRNLFRQQNTFEKQETLSARSQQQFQQFQQQQYPNNPVSRLSPDSQAAVSPPSRHQNNFSDLPDLDRACIYQYYFPYSNIDKVMSQLQELSQRIREKQLRDKRHENTAALPSKLERFMQKYNSKRDPLRQKSRSPSPLRKKRNKYDTQININSNNINNTICNSPLHTIQTQNNILHLFSANQQSEM